MAEAVHRTMPGSYVQPPESQRPRLAEVVSGARVPVVDLASPDRAAVVAAIGGACRTHGFFQVLNHGIDARLIADVMAEGREFFRLPAEEKARLYSDDPARNICLSTNFKETMSNYCKEARELGFRLYAAISESLGLESSYTKETAHGFYLPCPSPEELTYGLPAHTDPNARTILLMDQDAAALQVLLAGKWVSVNPQPGALIINIGDQLQALHNGQYRSVWHRAVTEEIPAVYSNYTFDEYDQDVAGLLALHAGESVAANPHPGALIIGISDLLLQIRVNKSAGAKAGDLIPPGAKKASGEHDGRGNGHRRGRGSLAAVLGIVAASSAIHVVAVGAVGTPVVAFGLSVGMCAGVSMAMAGFL